MLHAIRKDMTANQVKIFATVEAYGLLHNSQTTETIRILEALKLMVVDGNRTWSGYGFGECPVSLVACWKNSPNEPSVILLYKSVYAETFDLRQRMTASAYFSNNIEELINSAIALSFN